MESIHPAPPLIEVHQLVKQYGQLRAVDNVSLRVRAGEIVGLVGPNGAGKTTALRCCVGILRPSGGRVVVAGHDLAREERAAKALIAFVPELPSLYPLLTIEEQIEFIVRAYGALTPDFAERRADLLRRFDLWPQRAKLCGQLSKGMRQKTAIAAAFLHGARVILLDEPLIGVDPTGMRQLKELIVEARAAGAAILVSTHLLDTAERLCDRIVIMQRGRVRAEGSLAELCAALDRTHDTSLEEIFTALTQEQEA
ncbi:MAG: ABC transporter ATP-binding protein [Roseiflexaceae bacterium]